MHKRTAGVVVSCQIPILTTRVRFPGSALFFIIFCYNCLSRIFLRQQHGGVIINLNHRNSFVLFRLGHAIFIQRFYNFQHGQRRQVDLHNLDFIHFQSSALISVFLLIIEYLGWQDIHREKLAVKLRRCK